MGAANSSCSYLLLLLLLLLSRLARVWRRWWGLCCARTRGAASCRQGAQVLKQLQLGGSCGGPRRGRGRDHLWRPLPWPLRRGRKGGRCRVAAHTVLPMRSRPLLLIRLFLLLLLLLLLLGL